MPSEKLPFFAAEYNGRIVGIRRTADYNEIVNSILKAFPALADVSKSQIALSQVFPELGKGAVEITGELWKDVLPLAKTMQVVVNDVAPKSPAPKKRKSQHGSLPSTGLGRSSIGGLRADSPEETPSSRMIRRLGSSTNPTKPSDSSSLDLCD